MAERKPPATAKDGASSHCFKSFLEKKNLYYSQPTQTLSVAQLSTAVHECSDTLAPHFAFFILVISKAVNWLVACRACCHCC